MSELSKLCLTAALMLDFSTSASAQLVVNSNSAAKACYLSAKTGNPGTDGIIKTCKTALLEQLGPRDLAATHTNTGILYMRKGDNSAAQFHYKEAINLKPSSAETYINYGASLIYTGQYQEALGALNTSITLETDKMPEALYNRAIAYDRLQNYKGAYKDLQQALTLRPEWPAAVKALENYAVTTRAKSN